MKNQDEQFKIKFQLSLVQTWLKAFHNKKVKEL